jgi:RimJ/RimL family protein N-acetyltransferase
MKELPRAEYGRVQQLYRALAEFQPACTAVLAGAYPGRVFVDDVRQPATGLLVTSLSANDLWCFLAGDPANARFNWAVNQFLRAGEGANEAVETVFITCHPEHWGGNLAELCAPLVPAPVQRQHFLCQQVYDLWREHLPEGFALQRMDPSSLNEPDLHLPAEVRQTLERWRAMGGDLRDFGFMVRHNDQVAAWATVDFVAEGAGDAGLFTLAAYRRRGLATLAAAAAIEYGLARRGLSAIHWTCGARNTGSIRTAERLGCRRERDYVMYVLALDEGQNLAYRAYDLLEAGDYRRAAELYADCFALRDDLPAWAYFDAARAWAALDELGQALEALRKAVRQGWTDVQAAESAAELEPLRDTWEWGAILAHMKGASDRLNE